MRIVVLGAGGLGSVIGGLLAARGTEVTLVGRVPHMTSIRERGLRITGRRGDIHVKKRIHTVSDIHDVSGTFDYLILTVKGKDTHQALQAAKPLRNRVATAFSLQNSLDKDKSLLEWLGHDRIIGASTIEGGTLVSPGIVDNHLTADVTAYFGELDGSSTARVDAVTQAFDRAGLAARSVECIEQVTWEKLAQIILAATFSVTALSAVPGSSFFAGLAAEEGAAHFVALAHELLRIYRSKGYTPQDFYAPISQLRELDSRSAADATAYMMEQGTVLRDRGVVGHPSMYDDVLRGRKTEIDFMVKPYLEVAAEAGLDVPTLHTAYRIIKTIDTLLG